MSGSGRAGNGRGNNRKRLFRRREKETDSRQETSAPGGNASFSGDNYRNEYPQKAMSEKKPHTWGNQGVFPPPQGNNRQKNPEYNQNRQNRSFHKRNTESSPAEKPPFVERPKWIPPAINSDPLPIPTCPWCSKPIRDLSSAMTDKESGVPVHFDCVAASVSREEILEKGDTVSYIGAGRFGIVNFGGADNHDFKIKKIIEWENKDNRADWRSKVCDHFSVT